MLILLLYHVFLVYLLPYMKILSPFRLDFGVKKGQKRAKMDFFDKAQKWAFILEKIFENLQIIFK